MRVPMTLDSRLRRYEIGSGGADLSSVAWERR
jgi:hypothetical protein